MRKASLRQKLQYRFDAFGRLDGVFNGQGSDAYSFRYAGEAGTDGVDRLYGRETTARDLSGAGDFLFVPRLASSFDLTDSQTLVLGASAALGPNDTGEDTHTLIYGADAFWKWKPANAEGGWPFVTWQTEVIGRNFDAGEDPAARPGLACPLDRRRSLPPRRGSERRVLPQTQG